MRMARTSAGAAAIVSLVSVLAPVALPAVAATPRHPTTALVPLRAPAPLVPFDAAAGPGQGRWHPAGRMVDGRPGVYETTLVVPATGQEAGIAWMDPRLLRAQLYSGSESPGGGPWKLTAPDLAERCPYPRGGLQRGLQVLLRRWLLRGGKARMPTRPGRSVICDLPQWKRHRGCLGPGRLDVQTGDSG